MNDALTFRVRFRFRLQKKLNIKQHEHRFQIGAHEVVLSPQSPDIDICESEWLVMNARGFDSESAAQAFGSKLKMASELSSVATRLGIDPGVDIATAGLGQVVKDHFREQTNLLIRNNIHGVDVFPDDPNVRIIQINATGTVLADPTAFINDLSTFLDDTDNIQQRTKDIVLLLNYALMQPEPIAQVVFAFSAVEMLGQQESWSEDQKHILDTLALSADNATIGTANERSEVSDAIKRGTHKIGLRQGVMRLLDSLDLGPLKKQWDTLYAQRSTLMHALAPKPGANYSQLAFDTVTLCGRILLKEIEKEVAAANKHVDKFYNT